MDGMIEVNSQTQAEGVSGAPTERSLIAQIYDESVHWQKKFFSVPNNAVGKTFIKELAEQIQNFVDSGGMDSTALYNLMALPALMLQKPTRESCGYKVATEHLRRRLVD